MPWGPIGPSGPAGPCGPGPPGAPGGACAPTDVPDFWPALAWLVVQGQMGSVMPGARWCGAAPLAGPGFVCLKTRRRRRKGSTRIIKDRTGSPGTPDGPGSPPGPEEPCSDGKSHRHLPASGRLQQLPEKGSFHGIVHLACVVISATQSNLCQGSAHTLHHAACHAFLYARFQRFPRCEG